MSKKLIFILCVFGFIAGFLLREMLLGVSQSSYLELDESVGQKYRNDLKNLTTIKELKEITPFEVIKIEIPDKVLRGFYFEMVVYLKTLRQIYSDYNLVVVLTGSSKENTISAVKYPMNTKGEWTENKIIKLGPFPVPIPEAIQLGKYNVEVRLYTAGGNEEKYTPFIKESIEVVSHNK